MTEIEEVDFLMELDESGVVVHADDDARINNVMEWLATPEGEIYGLPSWGHPLEQFKHENLSGGVDFEVEMENVLLIKLAKDLPKLRINGINVESIGIDGCLVQLLTPFGLIEKVY